MSSPTSRDADVDDDNKSHVDQLEENPTPETAEAGSSTAPPQKRGRGRPKGSKNKKGTSAPAAPAAPAVPRKRGRPPKEKKDTGEEPPPKRPRGRPPKNPKPAVAGSSAEGGEPSAPVVKRKRGRPPKNPQPAPAT